MKKIYTMAIMLFMATSLFAQKDSTIFKAHLFNDQYEVYLNIDFYHNNLKVPYQEIFGDVPGYLGDKKDGRKYIIPDAKIEGNTAHIDMINDYGSEDLQAELTYQGEGKYILKKTDGSSIKVVRNRKWKTLPSTLEFINKSYKPETK